MAGTGTNLATTKDGGSYNKLQRPEGYLTTCTALPPPRTPSINDNTSSASMSKRKRDQSDNNSKNKRTRSDKDGAQNNVGKNRSAALDCGMRSILPAMDDDAQHSDDSLNEAMAYLRSVRSEATAIPHLLVADNVARDNDSEYDDNMQKAVYHDGTWIAMDDDEEATYEEQEWDEEEYDLDPQDSCYWLLLKRFENLRTTLSTADFGPKAGGRKNHRWSETIEQEAPKMQEVYYLSDKALFAALAYCTKMMGESRTISPNASAWMWALLASIKDYGTFDHEKVGKIRDLGYRAGLMGVRLRKGEEQRSRDEEDVAVVDQSIEETGDDDKEIIETKGEDSTTNAGISPGDISESDAGMSISEDEGEVQEEDEGTELEQARARLLAQLGDRLVQPQLPLAESATKNKPTGLHNSAGVTVDGSTNDSIPSIADLNTRVTIDMVLTIVAECFGQKDLLEYRQRW